MQVFLHQLDGSVNTVDLAAFDSLESLLAAFDALNCRVVYQGAHVLSLEDLQNGANLYLTGDLDGGKKKKKKKVYTTKKKNKHIHKNVKMSIYNLYSVDGTKSFTQARATSPSSARPVPPADPAPSWASTGIATIAASAIPPSRWTPKPSRRTRKS